MMTRFTTLFFMVSLILGPFCSRSKATEGTSNELRTFVDYALKELNSASFKIPQFKTATVDAIEDQGKIDGVNLYLCWLKSNQGRVGYISLIGGEGSYQIVSISATTADPNYFLKHLQVRKLKKRPLRLSRTTLLSFIPDVPLVAATHTRLGVEPVELSEMACCLSSVFQYLQYERGMMLFGHIGYWGSSEYFRPYRQDLGDKKKLKEIKEKTVARKKETNWRPFSKEFKEALARENVVPGGRTSEEKAVSKVRQRRIAVPILRRRLLNPIEPLERLELLRSEETAIENVTLINLSRGMRDAILIQENYLEPDIEKLRQNIDVFFRTRGLRAEVNIAPFEQIRSDLLPAILFGKNMSVGLLLGYVDIDGESFASVFFPKTGKPVTMTLAEKMRKSGSKSLITDADIENAPNEEMRKGLSLLKDAKEKMIVVEDRVAEFPGNFGDGVHLVRCAGLASWRAFYIGEIVLRDNWGVFPLEERKEKSK